MKEKWIKINESDLNVGDIVIFKKYTGIYRVTEISDNKAYGIILNEPNTTYLLTNLSSSDYLFFIERSNVHLEQDSIINEITITEKLFDLEEILYFQREHDIQIIRCEDLTYLCFIDGKGYGNSLTPMHALVSGISIFNKNNSYEK